MKSLALPFSLFVFAAISATVTSCRSERLVEPDRSADGAPAPRMVAPLVRGGETNAALEQARRERPAGPTIRFLHASEGDVAALVKAERASAEGANRSLLVYVGASWCEPCQKFHEAATRGELDSELPPMTLLEFDADKDVPRLRAAGYSSTYIPLFAVPGADGRSTGKFIEGGIKGEGAARELAPRIKKLLAGT